MNRLFFSIACLAALAFVHLATAQNNLIWDADNTTANAQDGSGTWSAGGPNWRNTGAATDNQNYADGDSVTVGAGSGAAGVITISGTVAPGGATPITFNAPGSGNYTLTGGTIDFVSGTTMIAVNTGATIASTIDSNDVDLFKTGAGTLTLAGSATLDSFTVNGGTGTVGTGGTLTVDGDSPSTNIGVRLQSGTLTIDGGTVAGGGRNFGTYSAGNGTMNMLSGTAGGLNTIYTGWNSSPTLNVSGGAMTGNTLQHQDAGTGTVNLTGGTLTVSTVHVQTNASGNSGMNVNLDAGGTLETNAFTITANNASGTHTLALNLDGGTLRVRNASGNLFTNPGGTSPSKFFQATVEDGGAIIDTNGFDATLLEPLQHDAALGAAPDGGVTKNGAGALNMGVANTYTGATAVNQGSLRLNDVNAVQSSSGVTVAAGAQLIAGVSGTYANVPVTLNAGADGALFFNVNGGNFTWQGPITVAGGAEIKAYSTTSTVNLNGAIGGTGGLDLTGGGAAATHQHTINLNAASTYSGNTTVRADTGASLTVNLGVDDALPVTTGLAISGGNWGGNVNEFATLNLNGHDQTVESLAFNENRVKNLTGTGLGDTLTTTRVGGNIVDFNGGTVNISNLTLTTAGGTADSGVNLDGNTTVNIDNATWNTAFYTRLGGVGAGTLNVNAGATVNNGGEYLLSHGGTSAGIINMNGGTLNAHYLRIGSTVGAATAEVHLDSGTVSADRIYSANSLGNFYFNGGTLAVGAAPNGTNGGSWFEASVTALVQNGGAVIDTAGQSATVLAALVPDGASTGGLTKNGVGTLTLAVANTYTGATAVNQGSLRLDHVNAVQSSSGATVAAGAQLVAGVSGTYANVPVTLNAGADGALRFNVNGGNFTWQGPITLAGGAEIKAYSVASTVNLNGAIGGTGGLVLTGGGAAAAHQHTINLNAASTYSGDTTIRADDGASLTVNLGIDNALPATTRLILTGGTWGGNVNQFATLNLNGHDQTVESLAFNENRVKNLTGTGLGDTLATTRVGGNIVDFNGGTVSISNLTLTTVGGAADSGVNLDGNTTVNIDNATWNTAFYTRLGGVGAGTLNVNAGATVNNGGEYLLSHGGAAAGIINMNGGTLNAHFLRIGSTGGAATAEVHLDSGTVSADRIFSANSNGNFFFNGGTLAVGAAPNGTGGDSWFEAGVTALVQNGGAVIDTAGQNATVLAALVPDGASTGGLTKQGAGTLNLAVGSTYTGDTIVTNGTLLVNNPSGTSGTGSGNVIVQSGATLGGNGFVGTAGAPVTTTIQAGGTLAPGNSPGTTTLFGVVDLAPGAVFDVDLFNPASDLLVVNNGSLDIDGAILTGTWGGGAANVFRGVYDSNTMIFLADVEGSNPADFTGTFANSTSAPGFAALFGGVVPYLANVGGQTFAVFYDAQFGNYTQAGLSSGNDLLLVAIPEPGRVLSLTVGLLVLFVRRRRG